MTARAEAARAEAARAGIALVVRFAVDDVALSGLHASAFGTGDEGVRGWAAQLERHALSWVGAFEAVRLVGFVQVAWDGGEHAFVLDTMVDPGARRSGIGSDLVAAATREARNAGCRWLHVDFEEHLTGFYLGRAGFRPTPAGLIDLAG